MNVDDLHSKSQDISFFEPQNINLHKPDKPLSTSETASCVNENEIEISKAKIPYSPSEDANNGMGNLDLLKRV